MTDFAHLNDHPYILLANFKLQNLLNHDTLEVLIFINFILFIIFFYSFRKLGHKITISQFGTTVAIYKNIGTKQDLPNNKQAS